MKECPYEAVYLAVSSKYNIAASHQVVRQEDFRRVWNFTLMGKCKTAELEPEQPHKTLGLIEITRYGFGHVRRQGLDPESCTAAEDLSAIRLFEGLMGGTKAKDRDSLTITRLDMGVSVQGTGVELDAIKRMLFELREGVWLVTLPLTALPSFGRAETHDPKEINRLTLHYAKLGFKPEQLGSDILRLYLDEMVFEQDQYAASERG